MDNHIQDYNLDFTDDVGSPFSDNQTRQRLKSWLIDQLDRKTCPGCDWIDKKGGLFKLVWKHYGRPGFDEDKDAKIFREWAIHTRRHNPGDPSEVSIWKTRFRNALHKMKKDLEEVNSMHQLEGNEPFRVYRLRSPEEVRLYVVNEAQNNRNANTYAPGADEKIKLIEEHLKNSEKVMNNCYPTPMQGIQLTQNHGEDVKDILDFIDEMALTTTSKALTTLPQYQMMNQGFNVPPPRYSNQMIPIKGIGLKLFYGENEILTQSLENNNGVRIAYRPPPLSSGYADQQGAKELIREIYGPLDAHQIYYPYDNQSINSSDRERILNNTERGLIIECDDNGDIYVTRKCIARVYYNLDVNLVPICLERDRKTLVFSYQNKFLPQLEDFKSGLVQAPSYEIYFSFAQQWSHVFPLNQLLVHCSVTHFLSKKISKEVKTTFYSKEIMLSKQEYLDEVKKDLENIALNTANCHA